MVVAPFASGFAFRVLALPFKRRMPKFVCDKGDWE
jgi:hypothetical protein